MTGVFHRTTANLLLLAGWLQSLRCPCEEALQAARKMTGVVHHPAASKMTGVIQHPAALKIAAIRGRVAWKMTGVTQHRAASKIGVILRRGAWNMTGVIHRRAAPPMMTGGIRPPAIAFYHRIASVVAGVRKMKMTR